MPASSTLDDVVGQRIDPALLIIGNACNAGSAGTGETCSFTVGAAEASKRFWFAVYPQAGLGDYQIFLTLR